MDGLHQKSAFTQPVNYSGSRACSPAECDITQNSQITHVQIPLQERINDGCNNFAPTPDNILTQLSE